MVSTVKSWWLKRLETWLNRRIPSDREFKLDMSNIFIFPSRFGFWFLTMAAILFILGTNYRNNLMLLLSFFLVSVFLVTLMGSFANFAKLEIHLGKVKPVFLGEEANIPFWIGNKKSKDSDPSNIEGKIHLRFWQSHRVTSIDLSTAGNPTTIPIETRKRGKLSVPRLTIESFYPLGLYRCWTHLQFDAEILVYPKPLACNLVWQFEPDAGDNENTGQYTGVEEDFDSLKTYQVGEPMHRIAWKQVARGREWVSKKFSGASSSSHWLDVKQFEHLAWETAISHLAYQVIHAHKQKKIYGLRIMGQSIAPGHGEVHMENCLTCLALLPGERPVG